MPSIFFKEVLTFSPLTGGCSEGLDAFRFFLFKQHYYWYEVGMLKVSEAEETAALVNYRYSKYLDRGLLALRRWPLGNEWQRYATT